MKTGGQTKASTPNLSELEQFFGGVSSRLHQAGDTPANSISRNEIARFFHSVGHCLARAEKQQLARDRKAATGFNVFRFIDPDENKLSDVLAFLLDPKEGHGQRDAFLRLLFQQLKLPADSRHTSTATVRRETSTHGILKSRRRIDVLVDAGTLVAIENKVDSAEQHEQVKDYLEHLHQCTRSSTSHSALIYLSPDGRMPESLDEGMLNRERANGRLHCWSYSDELRVWLEACRSECEAERIRSFLSDFINYIEITLKRDPTTEPEAEANEK